MLCSIQRTVPFNLAFSFRILYHACNRKLGVVKYREASCVIDSRPYTIAAVFIPPDHWSVIGHPTGPATAAAAAAATAAIPPPPRNI